MSLNPVTWTLLLVGGCGRPFDASDLGRLPLLSAVIKESMRVCPPAPFGGFRRFVQEEGAELCGYHVPKVGKHRVVCCRYFLYQRLGTLFQLTNHTRLRVCTPGRRRTLDMVSDSIFPEQCVWRAALWSAIRKKTAQPVSHSWR
jgi:hypothetical protein